MSDLASEIREVAITLPDGAVRRCDRRQNGELWDTLEMGLPL